MTTSTCPRCRTATVALGPATPWCPSCEWNLDAFDLRYVDFGWRWVDRRTHRAAYRLARTQYAALLRDGLAVKAGLARATIVAASVVLLAGFLALIALAVWLILYDFPSIAIVAGLVLLGVAWIIRPRLGRLSDEDVVVLAPDEAPALFALVDEVADAVGAQAPSVVAVNDDFNAWTAQFGLRRQKVLTIGLPLWSVLSPQERVAVLAHEMGHFVNGDVRRSLVSQPAYTMLSSAADVIRPDSFAPTDGWFGIIEAIGRGILALVSRMLLLAQWLLIWVGHRDSQRAEYLADDLAARVAGSTATATLFEVFAAGDVVMMLVRRDARAGKGAADWHASVDESRVRGGPNTAARLQLSIRQVSLFDSHPPGGLRARMMRDRDHREPSLVLTEERSAAIDAELRKQLESCRRAAAQL